MNKVKISIWGREFDIDVRYSCYPGEEITQTQKEAVNEFCASNDITVDSINKVKDYIANASDSNLKVIDIENIFKYVMPKYLYVPRTDKRVIAVMCNFKFDTENGIAVVYKNERFEEIGEQDIVL